jgi:NAD(P)-dependent dehydrogenase (short-subunit alcohol dehydrogenase family)
MWKAALVLGVLVAYWAQLSSTLPLDWLRANAEKRYNRSSLELPLKDKTAIITGASGGLGLETALRLHSWGCNVILAVRSLSKCESLKASRFLSSSATCECALIDTGDLESVGEFVRWLKGRQVDLLINNAGISYHSQFDSTVNPLKNLSVSTTSPQNLDVLFVTNYLGHWLLTQMLLPLLSHDARIINVASNYHWQVDGSDLLPQSRAPPLAAQALQGNLRQRKLAYANSKLAQVLHSRELQRRLRRTDTTIRAVSVCPGWVATEILPKGPLGKIIRALSYTESAGTLAILYAVTAPDLGNADYICNGFLLPVPAFLAAPLLDVLGSLGLRDVFGDMFVLGNLFVQRLVYGRQLDCSTSSEASDPTLMEGLFDWSASFVHMYVKATEPKVD